MALRQDGSVMVIMFRFEQHVGEIERSSRQEGHFVLTGAKGYLVVIFRTQNI